MTNNSTNSDLTLLSSVVVLFCFIYPYKHLNYLFHFYISYNGCLTLSVLIFVLFLYKS